MFEELETLGEKFYYNLKLKAIHKKMLILLKEIYKTK